MTGQEKRLGFLRVPVAAVSSTGYGDGEYPVLRLGRGATDGPATSILVDLLGDAYGDPNGDDAEPDVQTLRDAVAGELLDLGVIRLGEQTLVVDPCYVSDARIVEQMAELGTLVETVPGEYRALILVRESSGRRVSALFVMRTGD